MKKIIMVLIFISLAVSPVSPSFAVTLTSLTLEKSTDQGAWTNAPGGIWSTNTGDPLTQLGVWQGSFVNNGPGLGEISINLVPGINTYLLFGTSVAGGSDYYGLALFFDNHATPPDMAVCNGNGSASPFTVTPNGTTISGSANGGLFPDTAPGSSFYTASDGSTVELVGFNVFYNISNVDLVSWGTIGADGYGDVLAVLNLNYIPTAPIPGTIFLLGAGLVGLAISSRRK